MNIVHILARHVRERPGSAAIIDVRDGQTRTRTFAELQTRVRQSAAFLRSRGLQPGDSVLVFVPMSAELYEILLGIFQAGLVAMFLDPSAGKNHIENCCALRAPKAFIGSPKAHLLRFVSPALRRIPKKFSAGAWLPGATAWSRSAQMPADEEAFEAQADSPALLTFTSGSTGLPKATVRTHGFLMAQHRVLEATLMAEAGQVDLTTLPIFVLSNLASGVTSLIPDADLRAPGSIDPVPVIAQIEAHKPASTAASPAFMERIVEHCRREGRTLPSIAKIFCGGAPVFPRLLNEIKSIAPEARLTAVYGSTEAEPIAEIDHSDISNSDMEAMIGGKGLLTGRPVDAIDLKIIRNDWGRPIGPFSPEAFERVCLGVDEAGEIVVHGDHVLKGYLDGKGDEETKFKVDATIWHRTGDAGYLDSSGRLWLLGRCAAIVTDERGTIYPFAVESAVHLQPGVGRAAFVMHGGKRTLIVEPAQAESKIDEQDLRKALHWTEIDSVIKIPRIPLDKRHNAKIDYPALEKLLSKIA